MAGAQQEKLHRQVIATNRDPTYFSDLASHGIDTAPLDVTDPEAILRVEPVDGLFNCAGMVHNGTLLQLSDEDWAASVDLNVTSMIRLTRACLPGLLARAEQTGTASVLNIASMASSIKGFVSRTAYGTTKAAVIGLTKAIAADFVGQGIRCNALCRGTVDTPSLRGRIASAPDPVQAEKDFVARQPMGRLATVDEIAPMVVYLFSDESRFVTGQALLVDGGVTI
jgi:2-keto-3-deoxy-L-fuconate dehydrogenase